jgi:hypothetical protein
VVENQFIHDASLEMENSWAMEICKAPTLGSEGKDLIDKHGSFTLDLPQEPCLHHVSPESAMHSAQSTHQDYNRLMVLLCKKFRRMVVDAYVHHKYCRFHECFSASEGPKRRTRGGGSEWELIKILFKNLAYAPDFTRAPPQASLAKSTYPLECYWTYEQDPTNSHLTHAAETNTTRLLAAQTGQADS